MRDKIVAAGFTNMDVLVKKADTFAHQACQTVRKSSTGQAASKDVTMAVEEALSKLVLVCNAMQCNATQRFTNYYAIRNRY